MTDFDSSYLHPVFSCAESQSFEKTYFKGNTGEEWKAMNRAGAAVAWQASLDLSESLGSAAPRRLLVLVGKGHNGGDALIATRHLLNTYSSVTAALIFPFGLGHLRPLVQRSLDQLQSQAGQRLSYLSLRKGGADFIQDQLGRFLGQEAYGLCLDGVLGMQFRPPLRSPAKELFQWVNQRDGIGCRVAVDLPSGLGDESDEYALHVDFSYATGIAKAPLFETENRSVVGRIRYLNLGFFKGSVEVDRYILTDDALEFRRELRRAQTHKKSYGHVFLVGGSATMPGAIIMATRAALKSGVGLVTSCVPESIVAEAAAEIPEAMWIGLPEIPEHGGLALEGLGLIRQHAKKATGWVIGPGMGTHDETGTLIEELLSISDVPVLLDADALRPSILERDWSKRAAVITPHVGEFNRLQKRELNAPVSEKEVLAFAKSSGCYSVLKGSPTLVSDGDAAVYACAGGPVLARGGSGDVLAGLIGGRISIPGTSFKSSVLEGVAWQGSAADAMARAQGQVAAQATDILSFL